MNEALRKLAVFMVVGAGCLYGENVGLLKLCALAFRWRRRLGIQELGSYWASKIMICTNSPAEGMISPLFVSRGMCRYPVETGSGWKLSWIHLTIMRVPYLSSSAGRASFMVCLHFIYQFLISNFTFPFTVPSIRFATKTHYLFIDRENFIEFNRKICQEKQLFLYLLHIWQQHGKWWVHVPNIMESTVLLLQECPIQCCMTSELAICVSPGPGVRTTDLD